MAVVYQGTKIAPGIALGRVRVVKRVSLALPRHKPKDPQAELAQFHRCHAAAVGETERMLTKAREQLGEAEAEILDAQLTLMQDEYSVVQPIEQAICGGGQNMAQAIGQVMGEIVELFSRAEDEYMRARANDAEDVRRRLLAQALNLAEQDNSALPEGTILVAEELTPSDTIRMDLAHVAGIVTTSGGYYSHVGIISRNLGIPSVCDAKEAVDAVQNGDTVIVDGDGGTVLLSPGMVDLIEFEKRRFQKEKAAAQLAAFRHTQSRSADGCGGLIGANIGSVAQAQAALLSGAEGVGLMRSEFLYMDQPALPNEQEQFEAYRRVLEIMGERPVIIRTLDVGGDKQLPALPMEPEANPFLGCRAIRLCLQRQELFRVQLRALLRASPYGSLKIMFPMISSLEELRQAKRLLAQAREELAREGVRTAPVQVGIMIEIPAAALLADHLAKEVDFFSIGTNDLIQYTVAAERGNRLVQHLYSPYHPAVLHLIAMAAQAAEQENILCGMCGEAAADPDLLPVFWGMGLRELSMSPGEIARARQTLSLWRTQECRQLAAQALRCESGQAVQQLLHRAREQLAAGGPAKE